MSAADELNEARASLEIARRAIDTLQAALSTERRKRTTLERAAESALSVSEIHYGTNMAGRTAKERLLAALLEARAP